MYFFSEISIIPALVLIFLWFAGGWMITFRLFDIPARERGLVGLGVGMIASTWLSNFIARFLPLASAFWVSAIFTTLFGLYLVFPVRNQIRKGLLKNIGQWVPFAFLFILFTLINRGLAIFDDYQNLPVMSIMATGKFPPPFPFARDVTFNYHYILLLLATQFVSIGHAPVWTALDVARGITMSLFFMYAGMFVYRFTNKPAAQFIGVIFAMFAGGVRWLYLLMPLSFVRKISDNVTLLGSAAESGSSLYNLLYKPWLIAGPPPYPFPFIFLSGINNASIMSIGGAGLVSSLIIMLLLLLCTHVREKSAVIPLTILFASMALANEVTYALFVAGFALLLLIWIIQQHSLKLPASLFFWLGIFFSSGVLSLIQGGIITGVVSGFFGKTASSYHEGGLHYIFPPAIVSGHLGILSLFNPYQLISAFLEIGPVILFFPLVLIYGWNAFKNNNWLEASFVFSGVISLCMIFVQYSGNAGLTATSRLYNNFIGVSTIYAIPLVWGWVSRKKEFAHYVVSSLGLVTIMSGIVLFSSQLSAFSRPVASYLLSDIDVQMYKKYWNQLPADVMVFDVAPFRSATIFGRGSESLETLYVTQPEFADLAGFPDPVKVHAAGYDFMYYSNSYWDDHKNVVDIPCVKIIDQMDDTELGDFRRLVNISKCK